MWRGSSLLFLILCVAVVLKAVCGVSVAQSSQSGLGPSPLGDWSVFLPEDKAKALAIERCSACHDLARVVKLRGNEDFWSDVAWSMITEQGAEITREEVAILARYYGIAFGPGRSHLVLPINLNSVTAETIRMLAPIGSAAEEIVKVRNEQGRFAKIDDLLKIAGITEEALRTVKPFISLD